MTDFVRPKEVRSTKPEPPETQNFEIKKGSVTLAAIQEHVRCPKTAATPLLAKEIQAATLLSLSVQKMRKMRANGEGPEWCKLGGPHGSVRYTLSGLERYINENIRKFTGEAANSAPQKPTTSFFKEGAQTR